MERQLSKEQIVDNIDSLKCFLANTQKRNKARKSRPAGYIFANEYGMYQFNSLKEIKELINKLKAAI